MKYTAEATRDGEFWMIAVPEIDYLTQARSDREIDTMARDLIATVTDLAADAVELAVRIHYTSTARRDGRWWVVQNDQHPGAISQAATLEDAARDQQEAIAFVAGVDPAAVRVEVHQTPTGDTDGR